VIFFCFSSSASGKLHSFLLSPSASQDDDTNHTTTFWVCSGNGVGSVTSMGAIFWVFSSDHLLLSQSRLPSISVIDADYFLMLEQSPSSSWHSVSLFSFFFVPLHSCLWMMTKKNTMAICVRNRAKRRLSFLDSGGCEIRVLLTPDSFFHSLFNFEFQSQMLIIFFF
jgi:hypothetical protein